MSMYFEEYNDKCVLRFNYHEIYHGNKINIKYTPFITIAECKMDNYCKYRIVINENIIYNKYNFGYLQSRGRTNRKTIHKRREKKKYTLKNWKKKPVTILTNF